MATIYRADGSEEEVEPKNGSDFQLEELQQIVGGYIECLYLLNNTIMVVDEEGKLKDKPINQKATELTRDYLSFDDPVVGDVLVCGPRQIK